MNETEKHCKYVSSRGIAQNCYNSTSYIYKIYITSS